MQTVVVIIAGIIGFYVLNRTINHVHAQRTAAAAVYGAGAPDHFLTHWRQRISGVRNTREGQGQCVAGHRQAAYRRGFH